MWVIFGSNVGTTMTGWIVAVAGILGAHGRRIGEVMADDRIVIRVPDAPADAEGLERARATIVEVSIGDAVAAFTGAER